MDSHARKLRQAGLSFARRSLNQVPAEYDAVWLADSYGELGLWYRLAEVALIGGGYDQIGGHNPWEAAALGAAILHGPDIANFTPDYTALDDAQAARLVERGALASVVTETESAGMVEKASALIAERQTALHHLSAKLLALLVARPT